MVAVQWSKSLVKYIFLSWDISMTGAFRVSTELKWTSRQFGRLSEAGACRKAFQTLLEQISNPLFFTNIRPYVSAVIYIEVFCAKIPSKNIRSTLLLYTFCTHKYWKWHDIYWNISILSHISKSTLFLWHLVQDKKNWQRQDAQARCLDSQDNFHCGK
jgi:hypothetical protein